MTASRADDLRRWYVARVRSCQERNVAAALSGMGIETYVPVRREMHRWSDRRKLVEVLLIPRFVFVHCTEEDRRLALSREPRISGFLSAEGKPSVVRDAEMDTFRAMVDSGRGVNVSGEAPAPGDRVRVMSGPLMGMECELVSVGGGRCLAVRLGVLGTATMDLDIESVEKI